MAVAEHLETVDTTKEARTALVTKTLVQRPLQPLGLTTEQLNDKLNERSSASSTVDWTARTPYSQSIGCVPHYSGYVPQERNMIGESFGRTTMAASRLLKQRAGLRSAPARALAPGLSPTFKGDLQSFETARRTPSRQ